MAERCYYKVTDNSSKLYKHCSEFLQHEDELRKAQKSAIEARVPSFKMYYGSKGFHRIVTYTGFVFDDPESLDPKEWKTELVEGNLLSTPNKRTKKGKEMFKFLSSFERTNCWDVERLLNIKQSSIYGSFFPADLFKHNDTIYILIDERHRKTFEKENDNIIEITFGEMGSAIEEYNKDK